MLNFISRSYKTQFQPLTASFLLYKKITEQYRNPGILKKIQSILPDQIIFQTNKQDQLVSVLRWFKNNFMNWVPKDVMCKRCIKSHSSGSQMIPMEVEVLLGSSWKVRSFEIYNCRTCKYRYVFPRYAEVLKVAETRTGRCTEWSMLFGAFLNSLGIETRLVHDFLDHCWNEAKLEGKWFHVDSTLVLPFSLNHPSYYEENWEKKYKYVLAFTADKIEDVTQTYTLQWDTVQQRR